MLLDTSNRHLLGSYGSTEFETPNLDRLARRSASCPLDVHLVEFPAHAPSS
ncbi:MAG: hypothetical protein H0W25_04715 [Acidimicrobiia bacterium]|nr:hypothetical protein [Acidimicrobiia bacterium]